MEVGIDKKWEEVLDVPLVGIHALVEEVVGNPQFEIHDFVKVVGGSREVEVDKTGLSLEVVEAVVGPVESSQFREMSSLQF